MILMSKFFRFIVREFTYNEEELAAGKHEITKLVTDKKKQFVSILNFIRRISFSMSSPVIKFYRVLSYVGWK